MNMAEFAGILMDYHLIFMILCLFLFFMSIILIWLVNTKQAVIVSIFFLGINQLFCIISTVGFYMIGYVGYDSATGESTVIGYTGMTMFSIMFISLLWLNGLILLIALFKYTKMVADDMLDESVREDASL